MRNIYSIIKRLNNFIISFIFLGLSKILGFIKAYLVIDLMGTTRMGDLYKLAYNWPNLLRRITVDGALHYAIIPFLLESKDNREEFNDRVSRVHNFFTIINIVIIIVFVILVPHLPNNAMAKSIPRSMIDYYYRLFSVVMYPIGTIGICTTILNAKEDFQLANIAGVLGNITFIIAIFLGKNYSGYQSLYIVWLALISNGLIQMICLFLGLKKQKITLNFRSFILPLGLTINVFKSLLIQVCARANHLVANFIGSRLGTAGVLIASEFTDRLLGGAVGVFAITVSLIAMPIFNRAFNCGDVNSQEDSKKIIIATILIGTILSLFLFILSSEVTFFLIGNKIHIDNKMISDILRFSSFQILFYCVIKLLNTILIINRKINIALYAGLFASLVSTMLELLLYKKIGIYAMLIAQYGFLGVEFLILTYLLMKKPAIYKFLRNIIGYRDLCLIFGKLVILTLILILISKYILVMVKNIREFRLMFLMIYSLWGLITFVLFFKDLKIFIFKSKIPKHVS